MRPKHGSFKRTTIAVLAAAALAACGQSVAPGSSSPVEPRDPYGAAPDSEGAPQRGGTLVLAMDRDVVSFDPTVQNTNPVATAVYDSLLRFDDKGAVEPYLAEGMASPDGGLTGQLDLRD